MSPEFYIGYLDRSPVALGRFSRRGLWVLAMLLPALVFGLVASQAPVPPGRFEFGVQRPFEGILEEQPLPLLRVTESPAAAGAYLLVGFGKHGLPDFARGHHGQRVRFRGTLIEGGGLRMIEMNDAPSFTVLAAAPPGDAPSAPEAVIGEVRLVGELVDTKCYAGVMRPAVGKIHRACAVRCLRGGVPPGLLLRHADGTATVVLLTSPAGIPLQVDAQWAARVIEVRGQLTRRDGLFQLAATKLRLVPDSASSGEPGSASTSSREARTTAARLCGAAGASGSELRTGTVRGPIRSLRARGCTGSERTDSERLHRTELFVRNGRSCRPVFPPSCAALDLGPPSWRRCCG